MVMANDDLETYPGGGGLKRAQGKLQKREGAHLSKSKMGLEHGLVLPLGGGSAIRPAVESCSGFLRSHFAEKLPRITLSRGQLGLTHIQIDQQV